MILLIDNYDSFTFNLFHVIGGLVEEKIEVKRNDTLTISEILALKPSSIILSPGPCTPDRAGICLELVTQVVESDQPLLGVCLGHQVIGQALGGRVIRGPEPMHGKVTSIHHYDDPLFADIPHRFKATRYHSLILDRNTLPDCFTITAEDDDGIIMAISHRTRPIHGVQFHPESIASQYGTMIVKNFLTLSRL